MDTCGKKISDKKQSALSYLHDFVILLAVILFVFLLLGRIVVVSGPSMMNTLIDGDYLLVVGKPFYNTPRVGDVVVVSKDTFKSGEPIIKRVIATEGQTLDIDFETGTVTVDGVVIDEPYIKDLTTRKGDAEIPAVVPKDTVFVMGDNRNHSTDSRFTAVGLIDEDNIIGKAQYVVLPFDRFKKL